MGKRDASGKYAAEEGSLENDLMKYIVIFVPGFLLGSVLLFFIALALSPPPVEDQPLSYKVVGETDETVVGAAVKKITAAVDGPMGEIFDRLSPTAQKINEEEADPGFFSSEYDIVAMELRGEDIDMGVGIAIAVNSEQGIEALEGSSYGPCLSSSCSTAADRDEFLFLSESSYDLDSNSVKAWTAQDLEDMG